MSKIKERIIYAPGANETELLRTLAKKGVNTFGLRILNSIDLANIVLERNKIYQEKTVISNSASSFVIYNFLKEKDYFKNIKLTDSIHFVESIREMNFNILDKSIIKTLINGSFKVKNQSIIDVIDKFDLYLKDNNLITEADLLRRIINDNLKIDLDVYTLKGFKLKRLEKEFIKSISKNNVEDFNGYEFGDYNIKEYNSFFGEKAEIEYIFDYIFKNNINLDDCVIVVSNNKYRHIIEDIASVNDIPVTFGIQKSITESNPGKLLISIMKWKNNFYFKDNLYNVLNSIYFDKEKFLKEIELESKYLKKFCDLCGELRIGLDLKTDKDNVNKYLRRIEDNKINFRDNNYKNEKLLLLNSPLLFIDILSRSELSLLKYTLIREQYKTEDINALNKINSYYEQSRLAKGIPLDEVYESIVNLGVSSSVSKEGSIYVTSIQNCKNLLRKNLFVVGLSSELYPGSPKEDYVILDSDYQLLGLNGNKSEIDITNKKEDLYSLLKLNYKNNIFLSYPSYSCEDLKKKNASSMLFEIFRKLNGIDKDVEAFNKKINKHYFFDSKISKASPVGLAYSENKVFKNDLEDKETKNDSIILNKIRNNKFYATQIDRYFRCPYKFYLKDILGFEDDFEIDSTDDLDSSTFGNIIHESLEKLDKKKHSLEDYLNIVKELFENYKITHKVLSNNSLDNKFKQIEMVAKNAYELASTNDEYIKEDNLETSFEDTNIKLCGFPDRAEKDEKGNVLLIDYKTKNSIDHDEKDINTFGQILTYAYIISKERKCNISSLEYRYLKQSRQIMINNFNNDFKEFKNKMNELIDSLNTGNFNKNKTKINEEPCKYCKYQRLCYKGDVIETEGDDI